MAQESAILVMAMDIIRLLELAAAPIFAQTARIMMENVLRVVVLGKCNVLHYV